jgi:Tol biopolymer transport system component
MSTRIPDASTAHGSHAVTHDTEDADRPGVVVAVGGPSWSPDGRSIAFAAQNIYVGQPSTGDATRLTHPDTGAQLEDRCPAWSPDGRRIAFLRSQYYAAGLEMVTDSAIVVAQADGSHQRLLGDA